MRKPFSDQELLARVRKYSIGRGDEPTMHAFLVTLICSPARCWRGWRC